VTLNRLAVFANLALLLFLCGQSSAQNLIVQDMRIPIKGSGSKGLEALMVRPDEPGRHPLALLTHGTPRDPKDRYGFTPHALEPQAMEFARRGFAAVVVVRRGFGDSGGIYEEDAHSCAHPDYIGATKQSAADLRAAVTYLATLPEIDSSRVLGVGVSTGGLAMVALTIDPPPGLVGAINFAGGRGSHAPDQVCNPEALVEAFAYLGKRSRIPMLWIYARNDHFFGPSLAERFYQAFSAGGGQARFIHAESFRHDGHALFSLAGTPIWAPMVDSFLKTQNLVLRNSLLPLPEPPGIDPPLGFPANAAKDFRNYLMLPTHKALAISAQGHYGYSSGRRAERDAEEKALENCREVAPKSDHCHIAMADDAKIGSR
jgi:dienelactone hydrolase